MKQDACTKYAYNVLNNRIKACQHVRNSCRRHIEALENPDRNWIYEPKYLKRVLNVFSYLTILEDGSKPAPFKPLPFQNFILGNIFGWVASEYNPSQPYGTRKYQQCILFTAKGMGKTPLAAATSLYMCGLDGYWNEKEEWIPEANPQGYITATVQEQAMDLGINSVIEVLNDDEDLINLLKISWGRSQNPKEIKFGVNGGYLRSLTTKRSGKGKSGYRVSYIHAEEIHEWQHGAGQLDMLMANYKNRPQPLLFLCSNSGNNMSGDAWDYRCKAVEASKLDLYKNVFGYVAECDPEDLPKGTGERWWPAKKYWYKANPALNIITSQRYIENRVNSASTVEERNEVLRLNFGIWPGDAGRLFERRDWDRLQVKPKELPDPKECKVYISIDLAQRENFAAIGELYVPYNQEKTPYMRYEYWTPTVGLRERAKKAVGAHVLTWVKNGLIKTCDASRIDYVDIGTYLYELISKYEDYSICADPTYMGVFESENRKNGIPIKFLINKKHYDDNYHLDSGEIPVYAHSQYAKPHTFSKLGMDSSISDFKKIVKEGLCEFEDNAVTGWCLECVIVIEEGEGGLLKLSKRTSTKNGKGTDDGITVSVMCSGLWYKDIREGPDKHWLEDALEDDDFTFV